MIEPIINFGLSIRKDFWPNPGKVLEVGSYNVNGSIRTAFEPVSESYTGIDMAPGPGVDIVMEAEDLPKNFLPESFDTVLCCETLEHCLRPWIVIEAMRDILRPGGLLFISSPTFGFPLHRYPIDCYRFGEDAFRQYMFRGYRILGLEELLDARGCPIIACAGLKGS